MQFTLPFPSCCFALRFKLSVFTIPLHMKLEYLTVALHYHIESSEAPSSSRLFGMP